MGLVAASRAIAMAHMVRRSLLTSSSALPLLVTPPSLFWGLPQPLHLNTRSMKMFWMCLAHWDKSNSYTSPECLLKVQLQQTGLSGELEAGLCSALFPSSRDQRLFSKEQRKQTPNPKMHFPRSHPADPSLYRTPVPRGSAALHLPTGKTPMGTTSLVH